MPRPPRIVIPDVVYHVLNRSNERARIFHSPSEYRLFRMLLREAGRHVPMRVLAYALMPNHWHLVLWPQEAGSISSYMHWLTTAHVVRYRRYHGSVGNGHVYQGRFKCFPVQSDASYLKVMHYVEQNAVRANLVSRVEQWRWSSAYERACMPQGLLCPGPLGLPVNWMEIVNQPIDPGELAALRESTARGRPYGSQEWQREAAKLHGLMQTLRPRGRPRAADAAAFAA